MRKLLVLLGLAALVGWLYKRNVDNHAADAVWTDATAFPPRPADAPAPDLR